jgi:hypothetical protein
MTHAAINHAAAALPRSDQQPTVRPLTSKQQLLAVEFHSTDGRTWRAIGGGPTITEAISSAHESCPTDTTWIAASWNELYGD